MVIIREQRILPKVWYTTIAGKLDLNRQIWMGADIDDIAGMATSVNNYYKIVLSSSAKIFDFQNKLHIDKLVDKIMPILHDIKTLGEWASFNNIRIPIPMNKVYEAVESGDMLVYNAPNIQKAIKGLGFDGLTCLELNSLTCLLWNTRRISSYDLLPSQRK